VTITRRLLLQVTLPSLVIGLLLLVPTFLGVWSINRLQTNRARLVSKNVRSLQAAREMELRLRQFRSHSILYLIEPTRQRRQLVDEDYRQFEAAFATARETAELPAERKLLDEVAAGSRRYRRELETAREQAASWSSPSDLLRWVDAHPVATLLRPCEELLRINGQGMETAAQESEEVSDRGRRLFLLLGFLGPLGGLISGFGVAWGLSRSITRLRIRLQDANAHLAQELGSVRVTGEGDSQHLDRQLDHVLARVREAVSRLQQQQRELLRTEQLAAVGQLAASVAHEVRNPLTGMKLLVGAALQRQPPRPLSPEDLGFIHEEIERLERKVQALLDFARPAQMVRRRCDIREVVQQGLHTVEARARESGVRVDLDVPPSPVPVEGDRDQLVSVLVNLFLNALDAMPHGGALSVSLRQGRTGAVELAVTDSGPGIDPRVASRLFTPFTSTKKAGTGLGLSISARIVADHGGALTGENRPEGGARFTIHLPPGPGGTTHG
jgi:signal transduction histidine kinase